MVYSYFYKLKNTFVEEVNDEYMQELFAMEADDMAAQGYSDRSVQSFSCLRKLAIFTTDMRKFFSYRGRYDPFVRHFAVIFFDNYVSRTQLERNIVPHARFILLCCAVLAWKMRRSAFKLSVYRGEHDISHLIRPGDIKRMELEILTKLNWRMGPITSLSFLDFFIQECNLKEEDEKKMFKCFTIKNAFPYIQRHIEFTQFKPSIIAASGLLLLSAHTRYYPTFYNSIAYCNYVNKGDLDRCIGIMALHATVEMFRHRHVEIIYMEEDE